MAAVYFGAAVLGLLMAFEGTPASPVWPTAGLALGALLRFRLGLWPGIFAGAFAADLWALYAGGIPLHEAFPISLGVAAGSTLESLAAAFLVMWATGGRYPFDRARDVVLFIVLAGGASPLLGAGVGVTSLALGGAISWNLYDYLWGTWWVGDLVGVLIVTPLLMVWLRGDGTSWTRRDARDGLLLAAATLALSWLVFHVLMERTAASYHLESLLLPVVVGATFRFRQHGATATMFLISATAVWFSRSGLGPFGGHTMNDTLIALQVYLAASAATALIMAAVLAERQQNADALRTAHAELEARVADRTADLTRTNAALHREISEREKVETALRASEAKFRTLFESAIEGISINDVVYDEHGRAVDYIIRQVNSSYATNTGLKPEDVVGRRASQFFDVQREPYRQWLQMVGERGRPAVFETFFDPLSRYYRVAAFPTEPGRFALSFLDITDHKRADEALRESESQLRTIFELAGVGIAQTGLDGSIVYINQRYCDDLGYTREEMSSMSFQDVSHPEDFAFQTDQTNRIWAGEMDSFSMEKRYFRKDGRVIWGYLTVSLIRSSAGEPQYVIGVMSDITDRKRAEQERLESEEQYRSILESIADGYCEVDLSGRITFHNRQFAEMLGYSGEDMRGMAGREIMDPANTERVFEEFRRVYETGRADQSFDWEVIRKGGEILHVESSISLIRDAEGHPVGFRGVVRDVTERKKAEEALQESEEKYRLLFSAEHDAIALYDMELGRFVDANEAALNLYGYTRDELPDVNVSDVSTEPETVDLILNQVRQDGGPAGFVRWHRKKDGTLFAAEVTAGSFSWKGRPVACLIIRDITERLKADEERNNLIKDLTEAREKLTRLSSQDGLTGVANRRHFDEMLNLEWRRAKRNDTYLGLIMADIDAFKRFNDQYGHLAGDDCLKKTAQALRSCLRRPGDFLARYGGEEFVALLPNTTLRQAAAVAERMRQAVADLKIDHPASYARPWVTVSLGAASGRAVRYGEPDTLLAAADRALYGAKAQGGDRVAVAADETDVAPSAE